MIYLTLALSILAIVLSFHTYVQMRRTAKTLEETLHYADELAKMVLK